MYSYFIINSKRKAKAHFVKFAWKNGGMSIPTGKSVNMRSSLIID